MRPFFDKFFSGPEKYASPLAYFSGPGKSCAKSVYFWVEVGPTLDGLIVLAMILHLIGKPTEFRWISKNT